MDLDEIMEEANIEEEDDELMEEDPDGQILYTMGVEDIVNRRAGHIGAEYRGTALVWAGYLEVPPHLEEHEYWKTSEIMQYSPATRTWTALQTTGDIPTRCSGAAGCSLDNYFYVVGGFHRVIVPEGQQYRLMMDDDDSDGEDHLVPIAEDEVDQQAGNNGNNVPNNGEGLTRAVEIANRIWRLNMRTLVWEALRPGGTRPLRWDKTSIWSHQDKIWVFGGFGPRSLIAVQQQPKGPNGPDINTRKYEYMIDGNSMDEPLTRGWNNQLCYYDISKNQWVWPTFRGTPPCPRAAHSSVCIDNKVYIFGGRSGDKRLNDLHCLDMDTVSWTCLMQATVNNPHDNPHSAEEGPQGPNVAQGGGGPGANINDPYASDTPVGRSWQSLTRIATGKPEGGLLLYGGFDNQQNVLSDVWKLDLSQISAAKSAISVPLLWERMPHLSMGPRLWHQAVPINSDHSSVMIIGGLMSNILAPYYVTKHHADRVLYLKVAPSSLLSTCLDYCTRNRHLYNSDWSELPFNLRKILELRSSTGA